MQIPPPAECDIPFEPAAPLRIAYAARLEAGNKRSLWLIELMDALAANNVDFTLDIAGEGECYAPLSAHIAEMGLSGHVRMLGSLPHEQMEAFWRAHQVFVNFSISEDGPLTLLEAMGQGLAPVVTDAGCGKRLIRDSENGVLIASPEDASRAVIALARDEKRLHALRRAALHTMRNFAADQGRLSDAFIL